MSKSRIVKIKFGVHFQAINYLKKATLAQWTISKTQ